MDKFLEGDVNQAHDEENLFRRARPETSLKFDYEVNGVEIGQVNEEFVAYDRKTKETINFDTFYDTIENIDPDGVAKRKTKEVFKANCFKRLVSKKKHRIQNEYFDLDMAYITPRILAMGFPSQGCETFYRNSLKDAKFFLDRYHKEYKVYNLCLEKGRIYNKEVFDGKKVALFPFMDHDPCPIKLMLELCTDVCLYLTRNPEAVSVIHCKAGKGRTGMMIICYLIFSGLCENSTEALKHYAKQRTINNTGVTIPSQIRYIQYFETFLSTNFTKPYYKMIPQIMQFYITPRVVNTLRNYLQENDYFFTENNFLLKHLKIGPFKTNKDFKLKISSLINKDIAFKNKSVQMIQRGGKYYFELDFNSDRFFNYDLCLTCSAFKFKFYCWVNLWFSTMENISHHIIKNKLIEGNAKKRQSASAAEIIPQSSTNFSDVIKKMEEYENNDNYNSNSNSNTNLKAGLLDEEINTSEKNEVPLEEIVEESNPQPQPQSLKDSPRKKRSSVGRLINSLKEDMDLVQFIHGLNNNSEQLGKELFDMNNQKIVIPKKKLDKFKDSFKCVYEDFQIEYTYALVQGE